jgi:hypothetical protein
LALPSPQFMPAMPMFWIMVISPESGAESTAGNDVGDRGPDDGRDKGEGKSEHRHGNVERDAGVAHHEKYRDEYEHTEAHDGGAASHLVGEKTDDGSAEHGKGGEDAEQESAKLAAGAVGVHEILHGKGFKGKDGGVEDDAETDEIPVGVPEVLDILEDDFVGLACLAEGVMFLGAGLHDPVGDGSGDAERHEGDADQPGALPGVVGGVRPGGRVLRQPTAEAGEHEVEAEGETEFLALEPLGDRRGNGDDERLGAHPEDEAPRGHYREERTEGREHGSGQADAAEDQQGAAHAQAVDENSADEDGGDGGDGIKGIEQADILIGEMKLLLENVSQRLQGVVKIIIAEHGDAEPEKDQPAIELAGLGCGDGLGHEGTFPASEFGKSECSRNRGWAASCGRRWLPEAAAGTALGSAGEQGREHCAGWRGKEW